MITVTKNVTIRTTGKDGRQHEYHSMDDVPSELRAQIEQLQAEAMKAPAQTTSKSDRAGNITTTVSTVRKEMTLFRTTDPSGKEHTYHSLEELPPEVRAAIQKVKKGDR